MMLDRRFKHNPIVLCCFSLVICLSVWQLITGPGPPTFILEEASPFAFANSSYEYPMNLLPADDYNRLIDLKDFEFTILNTSCNATSPLLLVLIHSDPRNQRRRQVIRETWGQRIDNVVLLFVLGEPRGNDTRFLRELETEMDSFGDFIQGNFMDAYVNVTYKHAMVFKYAIYHCPSAKFILKSDDDVFVNMIHLMDFLHEDSSPHGAKDVLFCSVRYHPVVIRSFRAKWRVSFSEYRDAYYPDMCPGWTVLYSPDTLFKIYSELQKTKYFWIDDVLITGVLRQKLNLSLQNNAEYILKRKNFYSDGSLVKRDSSSVFLYGPPDAEENIIRNLWEYTMHNVHSKRFHYVTPITNGYDHHNHSVEAAMQMLVAP